MAAGVTACDSPAPPGAAFAVRDSAGIRIIESSSPVWEAHEVWTIPDGPVLQIGVIDGPPEYQFTTITSLWRDASGRIHVADRRSSQVRRFGPDGQYLNAIGKQGEGPGELYSVTFASPFSGDSTLLSCCSRMIVFGPDDEPAREVRMTMPMSIRPTTGETGMVSPGYIIGIFDDGSLLVGAGVNLRGGFGELVPMYLSYHRYSAEGEPGDTLLEFLGPARRMIQADYGSNPWEPYPLEIVRAVHGDRFYLGASRAFEFGEYSADGRLLRLIRADHLDLRLTREHEQEYFNYERASDRYAEQPQSLERGLQQVEFPETIPPYQELIVDSEDHLWVKHYHSLDDVGPTRWSVFAPEGHLLGIVEMPAGFTAWQVGRDFLLGVWRNELDVPYVRMYGLERNGTSG